MNQTNTPLGLYIHLPFCDGKCPYCDFYSIAADETVMDAYTGTVCAELAHWGRELGRPADTLYFGGGTPSLLGEKRLARMAEAARQAFGLNNAEITVEVNPTRGKGLDFAFLRDAGVSRLSIGLQSANDRELRLLGRRHTAQDASKTVRRAQEAGFDNISLDLMLAVQEQTLQSLLSSIAFCASLSVQHISAYLLKVEEGTPYYQARESLRLPSEDMQCECYLAACAELERYGFKQYEISNYSLPGRESRHNLKYWDGQEYLGIGASAHSFLSGKRFYSPRSVENFLSSPQYLPDGAGGGEEEYAMLRLRLTEGLTEAGYRNRFGKGIPESYRARAARFEKNGLLVCDGRGIRFTPQGFLVSNSLTAEVIL